MDHCRCGAVFEPNEPHCRRWSALAERDWLTRPRRCQPTPACRRVIPEVSGHHTPPAPDPDRH